MATLKDVSQAVFDGDEDQVVELVNQLLSSGSDPNDIINNGLIAGMNEVGVLFKKNEMFVPEVLLSAKSLNAGVELVKKKLTSFDMPSRGKVVLATVKGDLHDIGKNLVGMMMESSGYTVYNLGVDIDPEKFVEAIKEYKPDIVAMSALLTTTMPNMKNTIDAIKDAGVRDNVKIIIGGAPVSQNYADEIGADGYAPDAASATDLCKNLLG